MNFRYSLLCWLFCFPLSLFGQWTNLNTGINSDLNAVHFSTTNNGYVVGNKGIFRTTNGGTGWTQEFLTGNVTDSVIFRQTSFCGIVYGGLYWFTIGNDTVNNNAVVFRNNTSSPGWNLCYSGTTNSKLNGITFNGSFILCVGDSGLTIRTTNNGTSWINTTGTTDDLLSVDSYASNHAFAAGNNGLYHAANIGGGGGWGSPYSFACSDVSSLNFGFVVGVDYGNIVNGYYNLSYSNINTYDAPLKGRAVSYGISSSSAWIATADGIRKSVNGYNFWEKQPSADNYDLSDIFCILAPTCYAVGKNGLVLKTTNDGGSTIPYVDIVGPNGGCINTPMSFSKLTAGSNSYSWYLDGSFYSTNSSISLNFPIAGTHTLWLIATNGSASDTAIKTLQISIPPDTNKIYSVSDYLHCKTGNSDVTINNTDLLVEYSLIKIPGNTVISPMLGNGGTITLNTGTLTDSTDFLIRARHVFSDCYRYFTDTIKIAVEKTEADFRPSSMNADLNEDILFFNTSEQAATFNWSFGLGSSPSNSTLSSPIVSYNQTGLTQIQLIATSANGCIDTTVKSTLNIYDKNLITEDCWAVHFTGAATALNGHENARRILSLANGDVIVCGYHDSTSFLSKTGLTSGYMNNPGLFIASYTEYGILKWIVHGVDTYNPNSNWMHTGWAYSLGTDSDNNIYVGGDADEDVIFYFNNGATQKQIYHTGFIMKLDTNGTMLWYTGMDYAAPESKIAFDPSGNIYMSGSILGGPYIKFFSVSGSFIPKSAGSEFFLKMDVNGEVLWVNILEDFNQSNPSNIYDISCDASGNLYFSGTHNILCTFYSTSIAPYTIPTPPFANAQAMMGKYDSNGNFDWIVKTSSFNAAGADIATGIAADSAGNTYISLDAGDSYSIPQYPGMAIFTSYSGQQDTVYCGPYTIASYNTLGEFRWAVGSMNSDGGYGHAITVDPYGFVYAVGSAYTTGPNTTITLNSSDSMAIQIQSMANGSYFIAKYDSYGRLKWATLESGSLTTPNAGYFGGADHISTDNQQNIYVCGAVNGNPYIAAHDSLYTYGGDPFIAKYSSSGCLQPDSLVPFVQVGDYCPGDTIIVPFETAPGVIISGVNIYYLEFSDSTGSFATPQIIGTLNSSNTADTITGIIPYISSYGTYFIRVRSTNTAINGNASIINVHPIYQPKQFTDTLCYGLTQVLTSTHGMSYSWSPTSNLSNATVQNPVFNAINSQMYNVAVTHYCGITTDTFKLVVRDNDTTLFTPVSICYLDSALIFGEYQYQSGTYFDTTYSVSTCFISVQDLIVNTVNTNVSLVNYTFTSQASPASYQWIDCASGNIIPGETNQVFTPTQNGIYSLQVTQNGCVDTSSCYSVNGIGIISTSNSFIRIFPNPTKDAVTIVYKAGVSLRITDVQGNIIKTVQPTVTETTTIAMDDVSNGLYFLYIQSDENSWTYKVVKE